MRVRPRRRLDAGAGGALYSALIEPRVVVASRPDAKAANGEAGARVLRKSGAVPQL
jgi:hypothetical protein